MRYKCYNCGETFDEDDAEERRECVGEFWGSPAYDSVMICPECGSDEIEETDEGENNDDG